MPTLKPTTPTLEPRSHEDAEHDPGRSRPRLSVVVPAYNEAGFIGGCLDSLLQQDFQGDFEIIVVDNNSTDQTAEIARSRGVTVVQESEPGVCWARQRGTTMARGEIVISTDADTVFPRTWLRRIDECFRENPDNVAVAGPCSFVDAPAWGRAYAWTLFHLVYVGTRITKRVLYITATNIAFRKSAWPGYDTRATQGGDELDLLRKLRARGTVHFVLDNPVLTSSRRMYKGFLYNIAATFLFYYLMGYALNRLTGRRLIGTAPAFRTGGTPTRIRRRLQTAVATGVWLAVAGLVGDVAIRLVGRLL